MTVRLRAQSLSIGYDGTPLHAQLNEELRAGEMVCLLGANGVGKSTLMRTLTGMQPALAGSVLVEGRSVGAYSRRDLARCLGVVLTERIHAPLFTAYEVVSLGRYPHTGWSGALSSRDHEVVEESLAAAGAHELAGRYLSELSDGERQRVLIARALAQQPQILVLDEITAFLDLPRRVEAMRLLRDLAHRRQLAVLLSSHDLDLSLRMADRVWLMAKGGSFASGAPEDLVLSGAVAAAFSSERVDFDAQSGQFRLFDAHPYRIACEGEGVRGTWTRRALDRAGFEIDAAAAARVIVDCDHWRLLTEARHERYESLERLVAALRGAS